MRNAALGEVLKVWLYAGCTVLLGAWLAPLVYDAGKALSEVSSSKQINAPIHSLADHCRSSDFPDFYRASLLLAAALLLPPFSDWLACRRAGGFRKLFGLARPTRDASSNSLICNSLGIRQGLYGFASVTALFLMVTTVMALSGMDDWKSPPENLPSLALNLLAGALVHAFFQEILFRGIALSVFLKALPARAALAMSACLFALIQFSLNPLQLNVHDPEASHTGLELLGEIFAQLKHFHTALASFIPLLIFGAVLGYARLRTASLWLPIGLHAAVLFSTSLSAAITHAGTASSLTSMIWLAAISAIGLIIHHLPPQLHAAEAPP
jgi:membrane protease YdiL (CAAX protease family)